jgi:SAM-dependent methyltransferase
VYDGTGPSRGLRAPLECTREEVEDLAGEWDEMAAWWDELQGEEGDLWHRALIDPALFGVLGSVEDLDVLDLGCGNGYLARKLARAGARVTGVDASAAMVGLAHAREERHPLGVDYRVADAARLGALGRNSFDAVVSNMALMDVADAEGVLREVSRALRRGGRLVASLSHPCFSVSPSSSGWAVERMDRRTTVFRKVSRYRETFEYQFPWVHHSGREWYTNVYHRPLSWWFRALSDAGLAVTAFEEPEPTEEFLVEEYRGQWIEEIPVHCVIEARRIDDLGANRWSRWAWWRRGSR